MAILDRRNRLFGKVHILSVGFPLLLIVGAFAFFSLFGRAGNQVTVRIKGGPGNWWWVTPRPPEWYVSSVRIGDAEIDSLGRRIAVVEDVRIYESGGPNKDIYLRARLRASYNPLSRKYKYKGQPVQVGAPITLELGQTLFSGNVIEVYGLDGEPATIPKEEAVEKIVVARLYNVFEWEYDAIRVGEQMTDGAGNVIAEILDKYQTPAQLSTAIIKQIANKDDEIIFGKDPIRRDITITLRVKANRVGEVYVFREEQYLKVGKDLWAFFPSYDVAEAKIISIADAVTP